MRGHNAAFEGEKEKEIDEAQDKMERRWRMERETLGVRRGSDGGLTREISGWSVEGEAKCREERLKEWFGWIKRLGLLWRLLVDVVQQSTELT